MAESTIELLEATANVLLYCWIIGFVLLLLALGIYRLARQFTHQLHGNMFGISAHELDLIFYCWMGLLKLGVILLYFFPWLAIRIVLA